MAGARLTLNLNDVSADINDWPEGWYFARISKAEMGISQAGNPMIPLTFEVHSEQYGVGTIKDWVTLNSDFGQRKARKLFAAIHDVGAEDLAEFSRQMGEVELSPEVFLNKELLVCIGLRPSRDGDRMFMNVVEPAYAPYSHAETLLA